MSNEQTVYQAHITVRCTDHGIHQLILSSDEPEIVEGALDAVLDALREAGYTAHGSTHVSDSARDDLSPRNPGYASLAELGRRFARQPRDSAPLN